MPPHNPDSLIRILDTIQRCAAPIWASQSSAAPPPTVDHNGTCGFLDTGSRKILLTAWHVVEKFQQVRADHGTAVLAVNLGTGCTVALDDPEIIDGDASFDVASVAFPDLARHAPHDKQYFPVRVWPIARAQVGDLVALVGFPGERRTTNAALGPFEPVGAGFTVVAVSERSVALSDQSGTMSLVTSGVAVADRVRLGGFSGSPVFLVHPDGPQIIGILRAGSESVGRNAGNIVLVSPTCYLRQDGTFDRAQMPY